MSELLHPDQLARGKILVRVPNWVGDAVMCLPALEALRLALPESEITLLARPWVRDVFPAEALRCRVLSYDTSGEHHGFRGRWRIASALRRERFDAAILFQNAFDAAFITWLAGIPIRAGYVRHGRRALLTHPVPAPRKGEMGHETHYYLELMRRLGLIPAFRKVDRISLPCSDKSRANARAQLLTEVDDSGEGRFLVGISPGATFGTAKRWPAQRFAELATRLHAEAGAVCILFGAPAEQELAKHVRSLAGTATRSLVGRTSLAKFIDLIPGCDLFITNDTGTMHVAAALGVPTLAIFGPTNENETRPLGTAVEVVVGDAFCRPCKLRHCPIDHRCMTSIEVDHVFQAARQLLRERLGRRPEMAGIAAPRTAMWKKEQAR